MMASNDTSKEMTLNGGNKPQVKRSSMLPVLISKTGGIRQHLKPRGECSHDQQSANEGHSNNHIPENCAHLERSDDKENSEHTTVVIPQNSQHRYTKWISLAPCSTSYTKFYF